MSKPIYYYSDEQLLNEMKNRFEFMIISKKTKKYEFCEDVWNIIKEFSGIYHISTKWNVDKIGIKRIHDIFRSLTGKYFKGYTKISKAFMLNRIVKNYKSKELMTELNMYINPEKPKKPINVIDVKVGDEVFYKNKLGVVLKINKTTITWAGYKLGEDISENPEVRASQQKEYFRQYYLKDDLQKCICIKTFDKPRPTQSTEYYKHSIDWGY